MGHKPLERCKELTPLKTWLNERNQITLFDISKWSRSLGDWLGWKFDKPPPPLRPLLSSLSIFLKGCVPQNIHMSDQHGWGSFGYSFKEGYLC